MGYRFNLPPRTCASRVGTVGSSDENQVQKDQLISEAKKCFFPALLFLFSLDSVNYEEESLAH
jgi:hypothetical protein